MKIILSRKGFDSSYGGQPSPILPDGTLLTMPIPSKDEVVKYADLYHNEESYYKILTDLKLNSQITQIPTCHLDPDLRLDVTKRQTNDWKPIFGQANGSQTHLKNQKVGIGDIFLFFGWFRQTEIVNGKYSYVQGSPNIHLIFGYLQIGEIHSNKIFPSYAKHHPHCIENGKIRPNNCIYVAKDELSFDKNLSGAGILKFKNNLVLTKSGMSKSCWDLPDFFKNLDISHHSKNSFKEGYFKSAAIGQEFVISADNNLIEWTKELLIKN
jgi:hypothetical protein